MRAMDWGPGLRVAFGFFNASKFWEIVAEYTWLYANGKDSVNRPSTVNEFLNPSLTVVLQNPYNSASSNIRLHYNLAELMITRVFDPNPHLRLRLYGGGIVSWIKQKWTVVYTNSTDQDATLTNRWRFVGGGLRLGLTFDWFWGGYFFLTGKASAAIAAGKYKNEGIQRVSQLLNPGDDVNVPVQNTTYNDVRLTTNTHFLFGPSYQQSFKAMDLEFFAGYEFNAWFNLHEIYTLFTPGSTPDAQFALGNKRGLCMSSWSDLKGNTGILIGISFLTFLFPQFEMNPIDERRYLQLKHDVEAL